ncbi:MAG: PBP1A family penicillin-binding protein [Candidatus Hydrogenedentota bacterium]|nr:MAG: PBP1A family penicillin-binding protein [Candidatus Hydrogenedentota bacterium]
MARRRKKRFSPATLWRIIQSIFVLVSFGALAGAYLLYTEVQELSRDLPSLEPLESYAPISGREARWSQATQVFASDGTFLGDFFEENRRIIGIEKIPKVMRQAIIAVEDRRFDRSQPWAWIRDAGIDPFGILRAMLVNIRAGRTVQGGSTITQQLAKNLFLTRERTLRRKIQEMILSYRIEKRFSRDEILEKYLNKVFFGNQAYGIHAAAKRYFGVDLSRSGADLTLGQAALLAGLAKAPSAYSPLRHPKRARARQRIVLNRMVECGYIRPEDVEKAIESYWRKSKPEKIDTAVAADTAEEISTRVEQAGFFLDYVRSILIKELGKEVLYRGGYRIKTSLVPAAQRIAEEEVDRGLKALEEEIRQRFHYSGDSLEVALVTINHKTGDILAMVGGRTYSRENQYNRAVQAHRQPGSGFKPIVYFTALESGKATLGTVLRDELFEVPGTESWVPQNYSKKEHGPVLPREALAHSYNIAAVRMLLRISPERVLERARDVFGIDISRMKPFPSLALGAFEVTPLEMAVAYGTIANNGVRVRAGPLLSIHDRTGRTVRSFLPRPARETARPAPIFLIRSLLRSVVLRGTAASAVGRVMKEIPTVGKTGTTDDYADAWFFGSTPDLTTVIWVGYDERRSMGKGMTGAHVAGRIWSAYMRRLYDELYPEWKENTFPDTPADITTAVICDLTGLRPSPDCPHPIREYFIAGTAPTEICSVHSDPLALMQFVYGNRLTDTMSQSLWPALMGGGIPDTSGLDERARRLLDDTRRHLESLLDSRAVVPEGATEKVPNGYEPPLPTPVIDFEPAAPRPEE